MVCGAQEGHILMVEASPLTFIYQQLNLWCNVPAAMLTPAEGLRWGIENVSASTSDLSTATVPALQLLIRVISMFGNRFRGWFRYLVRRAYMYVGYM